MNTTTKLGRSLHNGDVTEDEIRKLTAPFQSAAQHFGGDMSNWVNDVLVVDGDLTIDGDFDTARRDLVGVVVKGSLRVAGLYRDYDYPATGVFVLGDMSAERVITGGTLGVAGALHARECLVGSHGDYGAEIHGNVQTKIFAPENHFFDVGGALTVQVTLGRHAAQRVPPRHRASVNPLGDAQLAALVVREVLRFEGNDADRDAPTVQLDDEALCQRVARGLPLLSSGHTIPAPPRKRDGREPARTLSTDRAQSRLRASRPTTKGKVKPVAKRAAKGKTKPVARPATRGKTKPATKGKAKPVAKRATKAKPKAIAKTKSRAKRARQSSPRKPKRT